MAIFEAERLSFLKNRHAGERLVLVCNGPSLNQMDLSFLRHETVFGLNKIFLGFRKFGFYPRYYAAVNDKVIEQAAGEISRLNCVKFIGKRAGIRVLTPGALTFLIDNTNPPARFCKDIREGIHEGWTVTYVALQIAYFLGFSEVVIIGMDHRFEFHGKPNEAKRMDGPDPNHFSPDYFGGGQDWDNPDLAHAEESYRIARDMFTQHGRRIIDATLDGACTIFEKKNYRDVFGLRQ